MKEVKNKESLAKKNVNQDDKIHGFVRNTECNISLIGLPYPPNVLSLLVNLKENTLLPPPQLGTVMRKLM